MKVRLLTYTHEPEKYIAAAAKLCYASGGVDTIMEGLTDEKVDSFINMLSSVGHESPVEHVSFTFAVEGISRACSHQLVRHRIASYSQQSQRYVPMDKFEYVIPPEIASDEASLAVYEEQMKSAAESYRKLADLLTKKYIDEISDADGDRKAAERAASKRALEDARFVLPNACTTRIILTMNARTLLHFFRLRCCNRAQWEIRAVADEMLRQAHEAAPLLFKNAGPSCVCGTCGEGGMSCKKAAEMKKHIAELKNG